MRVIVYHPWLKRPSVGITSVCLVVALGLSGLQSHHDDELPSDLVHQCLACMVASDLDDGATLTAASGARIDQGWFTQPKLWLSFSSLELVEENTRDPPFLI